MAISWHFLMTVIISSFLLGCCNSSESNGTDKKEYIVYMGHRPEGEFSGKTQHVNILQSILGSQRASESWMHSYDRSFNGFVAKLTEEEKNRIASLDEVVSVFPNKKMQLHTTRSWDFMGFPLQSSQPAAEGDVIVCMLDGGIWPENPSFDDTGLGPPPARWNGICESSSNFTCNNKIIGARFYNLSTPIPPGDILTPRDMNGHGSHTASTAAGRVVHNASMIGLARGTARGGVPNSRIAVYKVCWADGYCHDSDILQGFNDAIQDKCDVISVSLGGKPGVPYIEDTVAIGAFHAMQKGIVTSNSAGNDGEYGAGTVTNVSPWSITVAANTIDRKFQTKVELGNKKTYEGVSINTFTLEKDFYPLVYGGDVPAEGYEGNVSRYCVLDSLDPELVKGKIVLCDLPEDGPAAAHAIGAIMNGVAMVDSDTAFVYPIAGSIVNTRGYSEISSYLNTTSEPLATIYKSVEYNETRAPFVASFSSRGPNTIDPEVLKPDITAPGVDILAAWSGANSPTESPLDPRRVKYNIISGTSMSCPHVTGAAAYVKSFNPKWSPSAIKSALMTTATPMTLKENTDGEFAYGAGQINPVKAKSPGLIYDMVEADYVSYLCGQGYGLKDLRLITGNKTIKCDKQPTVYDFNYPSLVVSASPPSSITRTFHRTVTNVGTPSSTYKAIVTPTEGLKVVVSPDTLSFKSTGETKRFKVTVSGGVGSTMMHSQLTWDDGKHTVRSPIVVYPGA